MQAADTTLSTATVGRDFSLPDSADCFIAIDMKSFYASVECVARGVDPLKANLLVADPSRSDQTICLAVSPALKAIGVPSRPRLFEAKQAIKQYELLVSQMDKKIECLDNKLTLLVEARDRLLPKLMSGEIEV